MEPAARAQAQAQAQVQIKCEIVRWVDDEPQPGIVEARLLDADGRTWTFLEKTAIVDWMELTGPDAVYPCAGLIRCEVLDQLDQLDHHGGDARPPAILVTTSRPDGVESAEGQSQFRVTVDQLVWTWNVGNDGEPRSERLKPEALVGSRLLGSIAAWHCYEGTRFPSPVDVWLVLDPSGPVRVGVASDWQLTIECEGPYDSYDMQEAGRIEIDVPGAGFPFFKYAGCLILEADAEHEAAHRQLMGLTLRFETGAVRLYSYGGDLHLAESALGAQNPAREKSRGTYADPMLQ